MLADGRLVICGGEYSDFSGSIQEDRTNTCEIYDPVNNVWSSFAPPLIFGTTNPWSTIGDAACALLRTEAS